MTALRMVSAYRIAFARCVLVVAGTIPVNLLEAERIYIVKSAKNQTIGHFKENRISK